MALGLLLAYFAALIALSMAKSYTMPGKALFLLRAFFPSWKFFEDCGYVPRLYFRVGHVGQDLGAWRPCLETPKRSFRSLFLNPRGNFLLACHSLIQQLIDDLNETDERSPEALTRSVSYQLVRNLVVFQIQKSHELEGSLLYQFKLTATFPDYSEEQMLLSSVYEVSRL